MQENREKSIEELFSDAKTYLEKRIEYIRLRMVGKMAKLFADIVTNVTVVVFFVMAFILGSITLALYLSDVMGSFTRGFGTVTLIYLALAVLVFLTKDKYIEKAIVNFTVRKYFSKHADEEEDEKV